MKSVFGIAVRFVADQEVLCGFLGFVDFVFADLPRKENYQE